MWNRVYKHLEGCKICSMIPRHSPELVSEGFLKKHLSNEQDDKISLKKVWIFANQNAKTTGNNVIVNRAIFRVLVQDKVLNEFIEIGIRRNMGGPHLTQYKIV